MNNLYLPKQVKITRVEMLSPTTKLLRLETNLAGFIPGQFVLAGLWGYGEAPFGLTSSPYEKKFADIVVRNTGGLVTSALQNLKEGNELTLRGPYGNGFPLSFFEGKDIVMATGGSGIPPIASLIEYVIKNRKKFGRVYLLYGARSPEELLLKNKLREWRKDINVILTIDQPHPDWNGHVGFITDIIPEIEIDSKTAVAAMCGPGPMTNALEKILRPLGISDRRIFVSTERKMQCGIGKCQHCAIGDKYVCTDGPVFNFDEIDKAWD